ncbi:MAG: ATP-binding protein, partial [Caldilineaceae bacterium]|nr:ATP-binding protein [Caldilineaceae bacterium]
MVILGLLALGGAGYVSLEIIQNRRRSMDALNRGYNPYVSGEPVRREEMFFGRHGLVQRIVDTLHNNSIMIHGERRIGKTTLLFQLASVLREVNDDHYWFVPIYVDLEGTAQEHFFHSLIEEIADGTLELPDLPPESRPPIESLRYQTIEDGAYTDRDFNRDLRDVIDVLQSYGESHYPGKQLRLILLLDEMDVMSQYDHLIQQQLRRIFMREFSATLGAVVAGIQIS